MTVTHAAKTRKQDAKSVLPAEDQVEKSVQSTLRVVLPQERAEKEANGAKNPREVRKDDNKT